MILAIKIGKLLDCYGAKKVTLIGLSMMLVALAIPILLPNMESLFISQILMGLGQTSALLSLTKAVGNSSGSRDKLIAQFSLAGALGELTGPLIGGFGYEFFGFQMSFALNAAIIFISLIIGLTFWKDSHPKLNANSSKKSVNSLRLLSDKSLRNTLIISGLVVYSKDLFIAYIPIYANQIGLTASTVGIVLSLMAGTAIMIRLLHFWLVDNYGRNNVLTTTLIISGLAFILIYLATSPMLLFLSAGLVGIGLGLGQPISIVFVMEMTSKAQQGEVLGIRLVINRGLQFVAPLIFGGIGGIAGLSTIFWVSGGTLLFGAFMSRNLSLAPAKINDLNSD